MSKLFLNDVRAGFNSATVINKNSRAVEEAIEDCLSRSGKTPNEMNSDLLMNNYRIVGLKDGVLPSEPVTVRQVKDIIAGEEEIPVSFSASEIELTPFDDISAVDVQVGLQQLREKITNEDYSTQIGQLSAAAQADRNLNNIRFNQVEGQLDYKSEVGHSHNVWDIQGLGTDLVTEVNGYAGDVFLDTDDIPIAESIEHLFTEDATLTDALKESKKNYQEWSFNLSEYSGVSTSGSGTYLIDSSASWVTNKWVGYVLSLEEYGYAVITSNTSNTLFFDMLLNPVPSGIQYKILDTYELSDLPSKFFFTASTEYGAILLPPSSDYLQGTEIDIQLVGNASGLVIISDEHISGKKWITLQEQGEGVSLSVSDGGYEITKEQGIDKHAVLTLVSDKSITSNVYEDVMDYLTSSFPFKRFSQLSDGLVRYDYPLPKSFKVTLDLDIEKTGSSAGEVTVVVTKYEWDGTPVDITSFERQTTFGATDGKTRLQFSTPVSLAVEECIGISIKKDSQDFVIKAGSTIFIEEF